MKIRTSDYRVREGSRVDLKRWPTGVDPVYRDDADYQAQLAAHIGELSKQQKVLYASSTYSVLMILQAMDAAGKDGVIAHVMSGLNPQGCQVTSFKHPSTQELAHDFLWRTARDLPERGRIGIFNRSYYEEVLIVRVHRQILEAERVPPDLRDGNIWKERYRSIVSHERHLDANGTRIIKLFLHISKEEQRKRFLARLDDPDKNWKFSAADLHERSCWNEYQRAYEKCLHATSTGRAPWYVVPADDKRNCRLIVSRILLHTLEELDLDYPRPSPAHKRELQRIRRTLERQ